MVGTQLTLKQLQQLVVDLSRIDRAHYRPQTDRRENVAEHSMSVVTLAWFLHAEVNSKTDLNRVLKYALVHDFVETVAGDVSTYASPEARAQKELREREAMEQLAVEFRSFPDMAKTMSDYQDMKDPEAQFVWTADKMQALIMGDMDDWRAYRETPITRQMFHEKGKEQLEKCSPELRDILAELIAACSETYWDKD